MKKSEYNFFQKPAVKSCVVETKSQTVHNYWWIILRAWQVNSIFQNENLQQEMTLLSEVKLLSSVAFRCRCRKPPESNLRIHPKNVKKSTLQVKQCFVKHIVLFFELFEIGKNKFKCKSIYNSPEIAFSPLKPIQCSLFSKFL